MTIKETTSNTFTIVDDVSHSDLTVDLCRYGARVGGPKYYAVNLILRLFLYHFLRTMSSRHHESIHNNANNQHTTTMVMELLAPPVAWI